MKRMNSVLITGGSSGIGEALAAACAQRGVRNIFLCGRDAARLAAVVKSAKRRKDRHWRIGGLKDWRIQITHSPQSPNLQFTNPPIYAWKVVS